MVCADCICTDAGCICTVAGGGMDRMGICDCMLAVVVGLIMTGEA